MNHNQAPHAQESNHDQAWRSRVLAGGITALAAAGVLAPSEAAAGAAHEGVNPNAIPGEVKRYMSENSVYLKEISCSGQTIRNETGKIIGAVTAEHCDLQHRKQRISSSDGTKKFIVQKKPVVIRTGKSSNKLSSQGTINKWLLPKNGDTAHDTALGIVKGHTAKEVLDAYTANALTYKDLETLKPGEQTVYASGWPNFQPKNKAGIKERQDFRMKYVLSSFTTKVPNKKLNVLWTSVERNKDGAVCSFGASGALGFVVKDGKVKSIGTSSVFKDEKMTVPGIEGSHTPTAKELGKKDVSAYCAFNYDIPTMESYDEFQVI